VFVFFLKKNAPWSLGLEDDVSVGHVWKWWIWCGVWHPNFEGVWMKIPPSIWFGLQFLSHTQLYRSNGITTLVI
jgi:hypothetical protein